MAKLLSDRHQPADDDFIVSENRQLPDTWHLVDNYCNTFCENKETT